MEKLTQQEREVFRAEVRGMRKSLKKLRRVLPEALARKFKDQEEQMKKRSPSADAW